MTALSRSKHNEIDVARSVEARIANTTSRIRQSWNLLAADLYDFNEEAMWQALGYPSFEEWLAGPEIDLKRTHAFRLIGVYRALVVERGVPPEGLGTADVTKVDVVLPAIKRGQVEVAEALADAEALSRSDLAEKYGKGSPNEPLNAEAEPERVTCPTCSSWVPKDRIQAAT